VKFLPDTNIFIAALNGNPAVQLRLNQLSANDSLLLSASVLAELRFGALGSARVEANLAKVERLSELCVFVAVGRGAAERFAHIKSWLSSRGLTKSDADLLIAATALEEDAALVSNDRALRDGSIPDLATEDWLSS
jgi:tRNA(fMet)-specific endonuclease VapC